MIQEIVLFGITISTYKLFHVLGLITTVIFGMLYGKKYNMKKYQSVAAIFLVYACVYTIMLLLTWAESGFESWGSRNIVRSIVYVPLVAIPVGKLIKIPTWTVSDFAAPCIGLCIGISRIGCIVYGCCFGYHCSWGIHNTLVNDRLFPVQICETLTVFIVAYVAYAYAKKHGFDSSGRVYPLFLILFGSTRFFWEFFRDNVKVVFGMSSLALHAAFMAVAGAIIIFCLCNEKGVSGKGKSCSAKKNK